MSSKSTGELLSPFTFAALMMGGIFLLLLIPTGKKTPPTP